MRKKSDTSVRARKLVAPVTPVNTFPVEKDTPMTDQESALDALNSQPAPTDATEIAIRDLNIRLGATVDKLNTLVEKLHTVFPVFSRD